MNDLKFIFFLTFLLLKALINAEKTLNNAEKTLNNAK